MLTKYYSGDQTNKNKRGRWGMQHGRERRGAYKALVGMPKGRRTLERPKRRWKADIEIPRSKMWGMGSIYVALDRDRWRALVEAVKNRRFPHNTGNSLD